MIVTIDGPAGAGKSTAARNLARNLGIAYLDTGATYRAVAWKLLCMDADLTDQQAVAHAAAEVDIRLVPGEDGVRVYADGMEVTEQIRLAEVTDSARYVADCADARSVLVELQRKIGRQLGSFVAEGRDQGSVVFPQADVKIYLDADPRERAERRQAEMARQGQPADVDQVLAAMVERDRQDMSRPVGALVKPDGAAAVSTTSKSIEQVAAELLATVREALDNRRGRPGGRAGR